MPANEIAAYHTDLDLARSGDVYYQDDGEQAIVQFSDAARRKGDGYATFQIVLKRDGRILFYYQQISGRSDNGVIGIQNGSQDSGLTVALNRQYLKPGLAIEISTPVLWLNATPVTGSLGPGASATISIKLDARFLEQGVFNGGLAITADAATQGNVLVPATMTVNQGPKVSVRSPSNNIVRLAGDDVSLEAEAADGDGISKVEFFDNQQKIGELEQNPFALLWQNIGLGAHIVTVRATDKLGAAKVSMPVVVDAQADSNHNGLGDEWEMANFGDLDQAADADFDQDGLITLPNSGLTADRREPTLTGMESVMVMK
jgi:hypothetical protein